MKGDTLKIIGVGLAGYFIGFYEYKYKMQKYLLNATIEENKKLKEEVKTEES